MPFDVFAKRYFAGIVAAILAVAAYFQASGVAQLIGAVLLEDGAASQATPAPVAHKSGSGGVVTRQNRSAQPVIHRNPFDSTTGPLDAKPIEALPVTEPELDLSNPLMAGDCEGVEAVIVTESHDPTWSVAAIKGGGEDQPTMKRVGDRVGDKEVAYIGFNPYHASPAVWLTGAGVLCQALLFKKEGVAQTAAASPPPSPAEAPAPEPARSARGAAKIPDELASKIQKVSETEFSIERSVVDEIMENQGTLMRSARIVPEQKNGETIGIRLFGIRPDTLLGTLGIQNGDRLEEINGFKMGSPEQALEAYARLRTATSLNVKVNRRGKPVSIDYSFK